MVVILLTLFFVSRSGHDHPLCGGLCVRNFQISKRVKDILVFIFSYFHIFGTLTINIYDSLFHFLVHDLKMAPVPVPAREPESETAFIVSTLILFTVGAVFPPLGVGILCADYAYYVQVRR